MKTILKIDNLSLEDFIKNNFQKLYDFFVNTDYSILFKNRKELKRFYLDNKNQILEIDVSHSINKDFIILLLEVFYKLHLGSQYIILFNEFKDKIEIDKKFYIYYLYLQTREIDDLFNLYKTILEILEELFKYEEKEVITRYFISFVYLFVYDYFEYNKEDVVILLDDIQTYINYNNFDFLEIDKIEKIFTIIKSNNNLDEIVLKLRNFIFYKQKICGVEYGDVSEENSPYSQKLKSIENIKFTDIIELNKQILFDEIGNTTELHRKLEQGIKIIDEEELLYKYLFNYNKMHKLKLYDSYEVIKKEIKNKTISVIDWGCGQALASCFLVEFIKENNLNTKIDEFLLIEPSKLALQRGILHLNLLNNYRSSIKTINKDIDCLENSDLKVKNNIYLHLFSNILDVESFLLDTTFLEKISNNFKGLNYFVCVSPNINSIRNMRLDIFMKYFNDNFETEILSQRDNNVDKYKRYEKVFISNIKA